VLTAAARRQGFFRQRQNYAQILRRWLICGKAIAVQVATRAFLRGELCACRCFYGSSLALRICGCRFGDGLLRAPASEGGSMARLATCGERASQLLPLRAWPRCAWTTSRAR
jgi:hypothetical protein